MINIVISLNFIRPEFKQGRSYATLGNPKERDLHADLELVP